MVIQQTQEKQRLYQMEHEKPDHHRCHYGTNGVRDEKIEQSSTITLDEAIDSLGFGRFQVQVSLLTSCAWAADAMEITLVSMLAPALTCEWGISPTEEAVQATVTFFGMMCGAMFYGWLGDNYGRRPGFIMCSFFCLCFGVLSSITPSFVWLVLVRFLVGWNLGGVSQAVLFCMEFIPANKRSRAFAVCSSMWTMGMIAEALLGWATIDALGWRWFLFLSALPQLAICLCGVFWMPESFRFLLLNDDHTRIQKTLKRIAETNDKPWSGTQIAPAVQEARGRLRDLFGRQLWLTTVLLLVLWSVTAFCYYGLILVAVPILRVGDTCPESVRDLHQANVLEGAPCFLECKRLDSRAYLDIALTTLGEYPGTVIGIILMAYWGRKPAMSLGLFLFAVSTSTLFFCTNRLVTEAAIFVGRAASICPAWLLFSYTAEVYPTSIRAVGTGLHTSVSKVFAMVTPFFAQVLLKVTMFGSIATYVAMALLGAGAAALLPVETRDRVLVDKIDDTDSVRKK